MDIKSGVDVKHCHTMQKTTKNSVAGQSHCDNVKKLQMWAQVNL